MSAAWPSPTPRWRGVTEDQGHVTTPTELQWNEARRVHSEPVRLLCRPASEESLACSFSSQGTADDDVFLHSDGGDERLVLQWEQEDVRSQGGKGYNYTILRYHKGQYSVSSMKGVKLC